MKKIFLLSLIGSLTISALIGILIFLVGKFGDIESKILFTTLFIGIYSLTSLCSSSLLEKRGRSSLAVLGIIFSILGFLFSALNIWDFLHFDNSWKPLLTLLIISLSIAHACLLLLLSTDHQLPKFARLITLFFIAIVSLMLIFLVNQDYSSYMGELFFRFLGVFAILDVLGTIVTPILNKVYTVKPIEPIAE